MYDTLTRQITRRLSQNLRRPLAMASPLGRQLLEGLRGLNGPRAASAERPIEGTESAAAAASAANLAGWGLRNPRTACNPHGRSATVARGVPMRSSPSGAVAQAQIESRGTTVALGAGASTRPAPRAARCTVDPIDTRRAVISGRMSDVCDALDRLIALQAAQTALGTRFAI